MKKDRQNAEPVLRINNKPCPVGLFLRYLLDLELSEGEQMTLTVKRTATGFTITDEKYTNAK